MGFNSDEAGRGSAENTPLPEGPLGRGEKPFPTSPFAKSPCSRGAGRTPPVCGHRVLGLLKPCGGAHVGKDGERQRCCSRPGTTIPHSPTGWPELHPAIRAHACARAHTHTHTHTHTEAFGGAVSEGEPTDSSTALFWQPSALAAAHG